MSIDREEIARRHRLPEGFGERLVGETKAALEADAAAMAALRQRREPSRPESVNQLLASGLAAKHGVAETVDPADRPEAANFDGGARKTATPEPDSQAVLGAGLLAAIDANRSGR